MSDKDDPSDVKRLSFEEALDELKDIVTRLERGEGKLDDAIDAYQRGAALKDHCEAKLQEAEAKIERIKQGRDGTVSTEPLISD